MPLVRVIANWFIGFYIVLISVLCISIAAGLLVQRHESAQFTRCIAQWQDEFVTSYSARAKASPPVFKAFDGIVKAVAAKDSDAFRMATQHYLNVRAKQNRQRHQNPIPPLPSVRCGR